jgi:hypothetical protein
MGAVLDLGYAAWPLGRVEAPFAVGEALGRPDLELELATVQPGQQPHRHRSPQRLRRMAAPLGVGDQLAHPPRRRRALDLQHHRHLLKRPTRPLQAELVRRVEPAPHLRGGVLDLDLVQRREPRRLGQQSGRHAKQQILQRRRRGIGPSVGGGLVGGQPEASHPADPARLPACRPPVNGQSDGLKERIYRSGGGGWRGRPVGARRRAARRSASPLTLASDEATVCSQRPATRPLHHCPSRHRSAAISPW